MLYSYKKSLVYFIHSHRLIYRYINRLCKCGLKPVMCAHQSLKSYVWLVNTYPEREVYLNKSVVLMLFVPICVKKKKNCSNSFSSPWRVWRVRSSYIRSYLIFVLEKKNVSQITPIIFITDDHRIWSRIRIYT
jgi:hypothetical protein